MTVSELKYNVDNIGSHFFERSSMKFFGDTMKNYGVCSAIINSWTKKSIKVWELYRISPVLHGLQKSTFFDKKTFERKFIK